MDLERPFTVITPTADGDALAVLAGAEKGFTAAEVRSVAGRRSIEGMRRALKRLEAQGIVVASRAGNTTVYQLNRAHLAAASVLAIADLKRELIERTRSLIGAWETPCAFAAMFGSAARGAMVPESDVDLLVVRPSAVGADDEGWAAQTDGLRATVSRWTGNDVRVLELCTEDIAVEASKARSVLHDVRREGIWLGGRRSYLTEHLATSS